MIIGIEAERANNPAKTGVEHYAKQLILSLAKLDSKNTYILYLRTKPESWFLNLPKNFQLKVIPFPIFWTQLRLSWEMFVNPVEVLFIPASALPIYHPKKTIVTIHDLAWKFYPESFTWFNRTFLELSTRFAVSHGMKIIAVSEHTKKDIIKFYGTDSKKIQVVHHGYEQESTPLSELVSKLELPEKYILFLSTLQPRKNLAGLIEAFKKLKKENPELPEKLVVVGKTGWKYEEIMEKIKSNMDIVVYVNYVSDADKFQILSHASLLVLPSFYEGFGMQILEAFAQKVPVATSNVSSMPEVAGEGAIYFEPHNTEEIKNAIKVVLTNKSLAEGLVEKGSQRLKQFSWEKCANETINAINSI